MKLKKTIFTLSFLFWTILLISILIKASALGTALYDDESNYAFAAANAYSIGFSPAHYSGLFAQWAFAPLIKLFGVHVFLLRLIPLIFSTLTIVLTFYLAKKLYSEKVAFISSLIMITAFWHNLASIQVDVEGGVLTFFYVLAVYFYIKLQESLDSKFSNELNSQNFQKLTFFGYDFDITKLFKPFKLNHFISYAHILLALTLFIIPQVKNNGIFIFPVLFIASFIASKDIAKTIKELFIPFTLAVIGQIVVLGISYFLDPEYIAMLFSHGGSRVAPGISILAIMLILFWATPHLLSFLGLSSISKKIREEKHASLFITWSLMILFFVICLVSTGDYSRYAMNIMPAIAILTGLYLARITWDKKAIFFTSAATILYLAGMYVINFLPREMTPRVMETYISEITSGNLLFLFSYTSPSGPIFGITMFSFIITLLLTTILTILIIFPDFKKIRIKNKRYLIFTLLAIGFAFNLFLSSELFFGITSPEISDGIIELENYVVKNQFTYPLYSNNAGTLFMLDYQSEISNLTRGIPDFELDADITETKKLIETHGGTAIILNWPPLPDNSPLWETIESCDKVYTAYSNSYPKDYEVGWIYSC